MSVSGSPSPVPSFHSVHSHSSSLAAPPSDGLQRQQQQIMMIMKSSELEPPMYSYTSNGPVNWKALWNALLSGQQNSLRKWVADLPIKGCKVDSVGQLDVGGSVIPPSFALQLNEMLDKAVPPLADIVIDALCWRGIFLPSELANYDLLSIRLARNLLLLRPAGKRENKPLSLEKFLPFAALSPFHKYMLGKRLKRTVYEHQTIRKAYITWYKLKEFMSEIDQPKAQMKQLAPGSGNGEGKRSMLDLMDRTPKDLEMARGAPLGSFVQGYGYVTEVHPDGTRMFGTEEEALEAMRREQELLDEESRVKIQAEIEQVQLLAAEQLVRANFSYSWLKFLGIPEMKVHPQYLYHGYVSQKLNAEIEAMLPRKGKGVNLLQNQPSDQILMLILFLLYKNSPTRAMRISIPLLASNPEVMYKYLSTLMCKVALASCTVQTKGNKRNQAAIMSYLKMVQQYCNSLPQNNNNNSTNTQSNNGDPISTPHGLPKTQNYSFFLSLLLDFVSVLQRYISLQEIWNQGTLSSLLPLSSLYSWERVHLPTLIWKVFEAVERRRYVKCDEFRMRQNQGQQPQENMYERPEDTQIITWVLAVSLKLYKVVLATKKSAGGTTTGGHESSIATSATVLYNSLALHMYTHTPFPQGFGEFLKQEQGGLGPTSFFCQYFLWLGGLAQEPPVMLVRRLLQFYEEGFFDGMFQGSQGQYFSTAKTDDRNDLQAVVENKIPLTGLTCLEHLLLVLAPHSAILLAAIQPPNGAGEADLQFLTAKQKEELLERMKPVWDSSSEILLRIAYDPYCQANILHLSNPTKASFLLSKCASDEVLLTLSYGLGASSGDALLYWLKRHHTQLLAGIPELPQPGPQTKFSDRCAPLEKALLRLVRTGSWYTLINGFELFAPKNILGSIIKFLKGFTQRRYRECAKDLYESFSLLSQTSSLKQPLFGKHHFFAVVSTGSSGQDVSDRNAQSFLFTQKMLVSLLRAGLLIGMQGNIPSSHRIANVKGGREHNNASINHQGFSSIDLTDYDRNFLIDLFGQMLTMYGGGNGSNNGETTSTSDFPIFNQGMMNEILSIIPPTVSSSFLLNITSLQAGNNNNNGGQQGDTQKKPSHRELYSQHRYQQWKSRLQTWKENELYYQRKLNEITSLLDLELMVGISLDERSRFIRTLHQEMYELDVLPQIRASVWYQLDQYFFKHTHTLPDTLVPLKSNSAIGAGDPSSNTTTSAMATPTPQVQLAAQDPELLASNTFEQVSEKEECKQEILLLYLALENWLVCLDKITHELDTYFRSNPRSKPTPKPLSTGTDGKVTYSKTEFLPAVDAEGRPIPLPADISEKLKQQSQYTFVIQRVRGRIYWLFILHGWHNPRDAKSSQLEYDLNSAQSIKEWHARRKEREEIRLERETERMVRRAAKDANMLVEKASREAAAVAGQSEEKEEKSSAPPPLPSPPPHGEPDHGSDDDLLDQAREQEDQDEEAEDELYPPLIIDFLDLQKQHLGTSQAGQGGSLQGVSYGLEKFHVLTPSQYLPWNGSPLQNPSSAVAEAQARHRAIAIAFDEDMDITKLTSQEVRLLAEYSIDTKFTLALVESLIHSQFYRSALCIVTDVLDRFPSLRFTPRMQAAISLCDVVQSLFWLAHPTLQDLRINPVLSGQAELPFAGQRKNLVLSEDTDPFARQYKELLAWPILPHVLREEDQTWLRMRWYGGSPPSNQTLMLQRLIVDSPAGSVYQSLFLSLLLGEGSVAAGVNTVYSRTRPVGVDVQVNSSPTNASNSGGLASSFFGTMKSIGNAIKGDGSSPGSGGSADPSSIDVEHLRQWVLSLDESARVELLDRFVTLAAHPLQQRMSASLQQPGGLAGAAANLGSPQPTGSPRNGSGNEAHSLLKESFNSTFTQLTLRHLPLLCEIAQFLAISVRITSIELTKPRNKKLAIAPTPGVRITSQAFMNGLINVLVKTRAVSKRLPSSIPTHYSSRSRLPPDMNSPTTPWLLNLAENLGISTLDLLNMTPAGLIAYLWHTGSERTAISTLLQSGQIFKHFINHKDFVYLDREVTPADLSAALVETFLTAMTEVDKSAGPPSPFENFQRGAWWSREELVAFVGLADRTQSLALPTLAAAFRAQAFVIIKARDPSAAVSSSLLAETDTAVGLLGWWTGPKDADRPYLHSHGAGEFVRLTPGSMIEFELLHASYLCYLSAGRTFEMRQVASDIRAGLQSLLTSVVTKSKTPAPPIVTSPTNPADTVPPPFAGASVEQIEHVFLARLQLERCAKLINNAETKDPIMNIWRQFKKKAPATFA